MVCAIEIYEVYKVIRRDISEDRAVEAGRFGATLVTGDADFEGLPDTSWSAD